jgi:adenylylsulfate kinase-like enzyme
MQERGVVVWITGLSAAGKTTFALNLIDSFQRLNHTPIFLDGDALRKLLGITGSMYSRDERLDLAFKYAGICNYLASQGHVVVIATIALFKEIHDWNRKNIFNYREIFMDYDLDELRRRDPKGIYELHTLGEIHSVAGLDFSIDLPQSPHLRVTARREDYPCIAQELAKEVLELHRGES